MQWIPVEEQLPTPGENVLFVERWGVGNLVICFGYYGHDNKWYDAANVDYDGAPVASQVQVTHWMPLPDLPVAT
jgi:Protein of unknown function (DUF551)